MTFSATRLLPALASALALAGCAGVESLDVVPDAGSTDDAGPTTDAGALDAGSTADSGALDAGSSGVCGDWVAEGFTEATHHKAGELDYAQVFGDGVVQRLDITICPGDWQTMQDDLATLARSAVGRDFPDENPVYVPVLVRYGDQSWPWVGMRFKGNSTLWSSYQSGNGKLPFRLHFDKFEDDHVEIDDQRFFGFKELKFGNNYNDDSLVRDKLMSETLRESGVAAAKGTFARIYVDVGDGPTYWGLYTMFEDPTNALLDDWFGSDDGNMYKADGDAATLAYFDLDSFEPKTNDEATGAEVQALVDVLASSGSGAAWRAELEAIFEVDGYLRTLAASQIIGNWDAYGVMTHNYYLYADPAADGRLVYVPWDFNEAYAHGNGGGGGPGGGGGRNALSVSLDEVSSQWPLIRRSMDDEVYRAAYLRELADLMSTTLAIDVQRTRAQAYHDLIAPYVTGADGEQAGYTHLRNAAAFDSSLTAVIGAVSEGHRQAAALVE